MTENQGTQGTTGTKVSVIIPVVRPEKAQRCIEAIRAEESRMGGSVEVEIVSHGDPARIGCPRMVAMLTNLSRFDLVMFLGDDTIPQPGFLQAALEAMAGLPDGWGLVGLNDGRNDGNKLMTHWMGHKKLLPLIGGEFFHTGYRHCYCDNELLIRVQKLGRYVWAENARIVHDHPDVTGAETDDDYRRVYSEENLWHDRELFWKRSQEVMAGEFKLAIALPVTYEKEYTQFWVSFTCMDKPDFTLLVPDYPGTIETMRNALVERALDQCCTHILMMDTDQVYPPDTVMRLLEGIEDLDSGLKTSGMTGKVGAIGGVVHRRYPPFDALLYRGEKGQYKHVPDEEIYSGGLVEVDATGCGCILYRARIFTEIPRPWFETTRTQAGKPVGEDIEFCSKMRAKGMHLLVDTAVDIGHLSLMIVNRATYELYRRVKRYKWVD
jgi:hypothetical protein